MATTLTTYSIKTAVAAPFISILHNVNGKNTTIFYRVFQISDRELFVMCQVFSQFDLQQLRQNP